jgi:hypothetical protein
VKIVLGALALLFFASPVLAATADIDLLNVRCSVIAPELHSACIEKHRAAKLGPDEMRGLNAAKARYSSTGSKPAVPSQWDYSTTLDQMTSEVIHFADIKSTNTVD